MYDALYETITQSLVEDGYVIIADALPKSVVEALASYSKEEAHYVSAGIVGGATKLIDNARRSTKIAWLDEDGGVQSEYLAFASGLQSYLNRHLFLGLHYYEAHFALYELGDFYEKHLDSLKNSKNRVVTTVFYLDEEWQEEDGGSLIIYDEDTEILRRVLPEAGKLVVFLSEQFAHEVLPTKRKRHAIAGWFRVDKHS